MNRSLSNKKYKRLIPWGIALLACTLVFAAIELRYPYFFLRDDNADSYIAEYVYGLKCLSQGRFPFYCFNEFGGQRFFATGQTGLLNPLIALAALISHILCGKPDMMMDILAYLSVLIGCTGSFFLLKKLGCSDLAAVIGSIAWNFNTYNIWVGTSWMIVVYTTSVFPYFLITSLMLLEKTNVRNLILAVIPRLYLLYLGHPQFFIFAALFDFIFTAGLCLTVNRKKRRLKSLLNLIRDCLFVYTSGVFLALPLLVPEYQYTLLTEYGSARTYENLVSEMQVEIPQFFCPFLYTDRSFSYFYPPYIGFLLIAFLIAGLLLLIGHFPGKDHAGIRLLRKRLIAAIPCIAAGYLILFSHGFLKVISGIPMLNRFQYYHRISIFFTAFEIIAACLSMTVIGKLIKNRFKTGLRLDRLVLYAVTAAEVISFALLYTLTPHLGRGPRYDTSGLYDYDFAEQFTGGRYVTAGYIVAENTRNRMDYNLSENLDYNLAKLYGINNLSGYAGVLNYRDVIRYNECFAHMYGIKGSFYEYYPGMIEQMRTHSVCWYIVNPDKRTDYESHFKSYGIELVSETENSLVFYDANAEPYAYDINGNEVSLIQDVNSLTLNTGSGFPGGKVTLNYAYDPNFRCYIDGEPALITNEPMNWQYHVECTPGEHEIVIRYEDQTFTLCCIVAAEYIVIAGTAFIIHNNNRNRMTRSAEAYSEESVNG